jgi:Fe-Mn family superoxide dismutase
MAFTLPDLPYDFNALEPAFDARTMEIHHDKHHAAYVAKLNAAIEGLSVPGNIDALISDLSSIPAEQRTAVRNNGGGHANHSLFWTTLAPQGKGGKPGGALAQAIDTAFGSFDGFTAKFADAAATRFGSGWAWLGARDGVLCVCSTPNQDNPLMGSDIVPCPCKPILGLDVWEHAYYLNYQNRRPDYIKAFFELINWEQVDKYFAQA